MKGYWKIFSGIVLSISLIGLSLVALGALHKTPSRDETSPKRLSSSGSVLSTDDYKAVTPLINQIVSRLNNARKCLDENNLETARSEIAAAERLFATVRSLINEEVISPANPETSAEHATTGRARPPSRLWHFDFNDDFFSDSWDPFRAMQEMRERMRRMFDDRWSQFGLNPGISTEEERFSPNMDLTEEDNMYVVRLDMPGMNKSNIKVNVEGRLLIISGQTESSNEEKEGNRIIRRERRSGMFHRSVTLPGPVVADKVEAKYENGVLVIRVPKADTEPLQKTVPVY